jgi:hypothetical protein
MPPPGFHRRTFPDGLPKWLPWDPIPDEFISDCAAGHSNEVLGGIHQPWYRGNITLMFGPWMPDVIGNWKSINAMGLLLEWGPWITPWIFNLLGPHFVVHQACGGNMANIPKVPTVPLFWAYHAFIDDIYQSWLDAGHFPWIALEDQIPGTSSMTGKVPQCEGIPLHFAEHFISHAGLRVGEVANMSGRIPWVRRQRPSAGTQLPLGATVDLSGTDALPDPKVPQCWLLPLWSARDAITNAGLEVGDVVDFAQGVVGNNQPVMRQRPGPGERLHPGDQVHLGGKRHSKFHDE